MGINYKYNQILTKYNMMYIHIKKTFNKSIYGTIERYIL